MRTTEPNSPMARAKARPAPASMAGATLGRTMRRSTTVLEAPREAAASSVSRSSSASTGWTERTEKGRVTKARAKRMPIRVPATLTPKGLPGP